MSAPVSSPHECVRLRSRMNSPTGLPPKGEALTTSRGSWGACLLGRLSTMAAALHIFGGDETALPLGPDDVRAPLGRRLAPARPRGAAGRAACFGCGEGPALER